MKYLQVSVLLLLCATLLFAGEAPPYTRESNFFKARRKTERYFRRTFEELKNENLTARQRDEALKEQEEYAEYKRWENFWRDRTLPNGKYPSPSFLYTEFLKRQAVSSHSSSSLTNWSCISQTQCDGGYNGMGRTTCTAFHPTDPNIFFVGSPNGGIWKTVDGGINYTPLGDQLPFVSAGAILVDPVNPDLLYVSTGDAVGWWNFNTGIFKSTDGGLTWNPTGLSWQLSAQHAIYNMVFQPGNSSTIFAATTAGLYRTTNSGASWSLIRSGSVNDIEFKPGSTTELYISTDDYWGSSEVYSSNNNGLGWTQLTSFNTPYNAIKISVTASNPDELAVYSSTNNEIYLSTDAGTTFTLKCTGAPGMGAFMIAPTNAGILYCGNVNVSKSIDAGATWTTITSWYSAPPLPTVHADLHNICYSPLHPGDLYFNNDGGLYKYRQAFGTWTELSNHLVITQFYTLANSQTDPDFVIGGTQDNGGRKRTAPGTWASTNGGDAMETAVDPVDDNIIYTTYVNGTLYRSMDQWVADVYHEITPRDPAGNFLSGDWVTPYLLNPQNPSTIFAAYEEVYKSTDRGDTWTAISQNLTGGDDLYELAVAPSDSQVVYASRGNVLYRTDDGGQSWTSTTLPGSERISCILVHPSQPATLWISRSGFGAKVFKSSNFGATFQDLSGSLPNVPANCLFYEPGSANGIYAGMDLGVFYTNDSMSDWVGFNNGLPAVQVTDFAFCSSTGKLRISTFGRGIWETDLYSIAMTTPFLEKQNHISIYPNPANDVLSISLPYDAIARETELNVYDSRGDLVLTRKSSSCTMELETSGFENGIYFLRMHHPGELPISSKFVIQH